MTRFAFLGSHPLGEACLERLHDHPDAEVAVVCTYERDHDGWWEGSVHERAREYGYPVLTIDEERRLLEHDVDYLLSVYYPNVIGPDLLAHPRELPLNLHQAELPRYRGSNVFTHSILNAREDDYWYHGTTLHVMAESVDAGDVIDREFVSIREADTARSLYERTREASIELFERSLPRILADEVAELATPQSDFDGPRYFYRKDSLEGRKEIPPARLADSAAATAVYDLVRALEFPPHEPAYTTVDGRRVHLTTGYEGEG